MSAEPEILVKETNNVGILILNRPKALNALSLTITKGLYDNLKKFENEKQLVIIKATGRAFCSGGDVVTLQKMSRDTDESPLRYFCKLLYEVFFLINTYKIPLIVLVNGITFGGGAAITALSKCAIVTEKALFSMPETKFGFHPNAGASYFLNRAKGQLGIYMGLTGQRLKGADIVSAGFATNFCHSSKLEQFEEHLVNCCNRSDVNNVIKRFCDSELPPFNLDPLINSINRIFSEPTIENIILKLKQDKSDWAKQTLDLLQSYSPSSMKVSLRQLQVGKNMDLLDCLTMEMNLTSNFYKFNDASEGAKALLVHKTNMPKWNPPTLSAVSEEIIQEHFKAAGGDLLKEALIERLREVNNAKSKL